MKMDTDYFYKNVDVIVPIEDARTHKLKRVVTCKISQINNYTNDWECDRDWKFADEQTDEKIKEYFEWVSQYCDPSRFEQFLISLLD